MPFDNTAKNLMLDQLATLATRISLHSADPGTAADNETTAPREIPTWAAAAGGDLALASSILFEGGASSGAVTWYAVWNTDGSVRYGKGQITTGDTAFNASGEFTLTTAARLRITG